MLTDNNNEESDTETNNVNLEQNLSEISCQNNGNLYDQVDKVNITYPTSDIQNKVITSGGGLNSPLDAGERTLCPSSNFTR